MSSFKKNRTIRLRIQREKAKAKNNGQEIKWGRNQVACGYILTLYREKKRKRQQLLNCLILTFFFCIELIYV